MQYTTYSHDQTKSTNPRSRIHLGNQPSGGGSAKVNQRSGNGPFGPTVRVGGTGQTLVGDTYRELTGTDSVYVSKARNFVVVGRISCIAKQHSRPEL